MKRFLATMLAGILFLATTLGHTFPSLADSSVVAKLTISKDGQAVSAVQPGDIIDVMFSIENYEMQEIPATLILAYIPIDTDIMEYVDQSLKNESTISAANGILLMAYNKAQKQVGFQFSPTDQQIIIDKDTRNICSFQLKVLENIDKDINSQLGVGRFEMNNGSASEIISLSTKVESIGLDILGAKPSITLNGQPAEDSPYTDSVLLKADKGTVILEHGGKSVDVTSDALSVNGYHVMENGNYTVTATDSVGNQTVQRFSINLEIQSIELVSLPNRLVYTEGKTDYIDVEGGVVKVNYINGTSTEIPLALDMCSGYDLQNIGFSTVTVTYGENSAEFQVEVAEKAPISIEMETLPDRVSYPQNIEFQIDGAKIKVTYDNGTTDILDVTEGMLKKLPDMTVIGKQTVVVTYEGFDAEFTITVSEKAVKELLVVSTPSNATVVEGMEPDLTGGVLKVIYDNGTTEEIDMVLSMIQDYDRNQLGEQEITIVFGGKQVVIKIQVVEKSIKSLQLISKPDKVKYLEGEELELDGLVVKAIYDNQFNEEIPVEELDIEGFDSDKTGQQRIYINYEGQRTSFTVTVLSRAKLDAFLDALNEIDIDSLTRDEEWDVIELEQMYRGLSKLEQSKVDNTDKEKLEEAIGLMKELIVVEYPEYGITIMPELGAIPQGYEMIATDSDADEQKAEEILTEQNLYGKKFRVRNLFKITVTGRKYKSLPENFGLVKIKVEDNGDSKVKVAEIDLKALRATDSNAQKQDDGYIFKLKSFGDYVVVEVIKDESDLPDPDIPDVPDVPNPPDEPDEPDIPNPPVVDPDKKPSYDDDDDGDDYFAGQWMKDQFGWWFRNSDNSYPANEWKQVGGIWYLFDANGYMLTGWQQVNNVWYYMDASGAMRIGWVLDSTGNWYYMNASGSMAQGWVYYKDNWYFLKPDGAMAKGWLEDKDNWYFLNDNGEMVHDTVIDGFQIGNDGRRVN